MPLLKRLGEDSYLEYIVVVHEMMQKQEYLTFELCHRDTPRLHREVMPLQKHAGS
jgi:hypothetical protein